MAEPNDDLEQWVLNLRTDVAANPPVWIDADPNSQYPTSQRPSEVVTPESLPHGQLGTSIPEVRSTGRHRTPD